MILRTRRVVEEYRERGVVGGDLKKGIRETDRRSHIDGKKGFPTNGRSFHDDNTQKRLRVEKGDW